jgi:uncharacterized membrane protein YoaK (UPF0700 family)
MPFKLATSLTSVDRTRRADMSLGLLLAFVAGAINAGGFLAVGQYTSHMTGLVSSMADNLVLGQISVVLSAFAGVISFLGGAITCSVMVHFSRKRQLRTEYAAPLLLEAILLLLFGLLGSQIQWVRAVFVPLTVVILCFLMGLQNALITKISNSVIRTTHVTGLLTDLGIELGKMAYINRTRGEDTLHVRADRNKFKRLSGLLACFFVGGIVGAYGFSRFGFAAVLPFSVLLMLIGIAGLISPVAGPKAPTSNT